MKILVLEAKKHRLNFAVFDRETLFKISYGYVENIGLPHGRITVFVRSEGKVEKHVEIIDLYDVSVSFQKIIRMLQQEYIEVIGDVREITVVGHRIAHGGEFFVGPTLINRDVKKQIKDLIPYAPEHNKYNLSCLRVSQQVLSQAKHIAFFETSYFLSMPERAFKYSLPVRFYEKHAIRKYGAHGLTHEYLLRRGVDALEIDIADTNIISINLENECSLAAVSQGECIDSTAGLSPASGISSDGLQADIDPSVIDFMMRNTGVRARDLHEIMKTDISYLNRTGEYQLEVLLEQVKLASSDAIKSIRNLAYQIKKVIGSYLAVLGRVDAILMTTGPENSDVLRRLILQDLEHLGISIDEDQNKSVVQDYTFIESTASKIPVILVSPDEVYLMAETLKSASEELALA